MSKFINKIKDLELETWIKYWIYRTSGGGNYKFALSEIKEGSNFYLENTIKRKFNIFEVYGKTTQNGTPTPENPIPIINLTGNINEKIQNKNIVSLETSKEKVVDGLPFTVEDGIIKINGTNTSTNSFFFDSFKTNSGTAMFWVEISGYTDKDSSNASILLQQSDDNINFSTLVEVQLKSNLNKTRQVTLDSNKYYRIRFYVNKNTFTNSEIKVQLEYGNQKTTFIPHAEQNISFPLEQGQIFAQGDYLADDGIHHKRGKVVLDGTENWNYNSSNNVFVIADFINYKIGAYTPMSTHYIGQINITEYRDIIDKRITCLNSSTSNRTIIKDTRFTSSNDFKNYLAEQYANGTPVEVEYELATEVIEPYTEEQQTAYNQIKELYTYNEITNIDGDANLKIKYWKRVER